MSWTAEDESRLQRGISMVEQMEQQKAAAAVPQFDNLRQLRAALRARLPASVTNEQIAELADNIVLNAAAFIRILQTFVP